MNIERFARRLLLQMVAGVVIAAVILLVQWAMNH